MNIVTRTACNPDIRQGKRRKNPPVFFLFIVGCFKDKTLNKIVRTMLVQFFANLLTYKLITFCFINREREREKESVTLVY